MVNFRLSRISSRLLALESRSSDKTEVVLAVLVLLVVPVVPTILAVLLVLVLVRVPLLVIVPVAWKETCCHSRSRAAKDSRKDATRGPRQQNTQKKSQPECPRSKTREKTTNDFGGAGGRMRLSWLSNFGGAKFTTTPADGKFWVAEIYEVCVSLWATFVVEKFWVVKFYAFRVLIRRGNPKFTHFAFRSCQRN